MGKISGKMTVRGISASRADILGPWLDEILPGGPHTKSVNSTTMTTTFDDTPIHCRGASALSVTSKKNLKGYFVPSQPRTSQGGWSRAHARGEADADGIHGHLLLHSDAFFKSFHSLVLTLPTLADSNMYIASADGTDRCPWRTSSFGQQPTKVQCPSDTYSIWMWDTSPSTGGRVEPAPTAVLDIYDPDLLYETPLWIEVSREFEEEQGQNQ